ncbi:MAG: GspH/FimT family pseudopilin [Armatimonadetes bacterium]|nr:GspH/FimT family pseudopilin [Armatimonadota bacterium]
MSVVIVVLAMMAALIVPNLVTSLRGGQVKVYRQSVFDIVRQGREEAVTRGTTVTLKGEESGVFSLTQAGEDGDATIKETREGGDVTASGFESFSTASTDAEWSTRFFPDGSSEGGAFQLDEGSSSVTVRIRRADGRMTVTSGPVSDNANDETKWEVGTW